MIATDTVLEALSLGQRRSLTLIVIFLYKQFFFTRQANVVVEVIQKEQKWNLKISIR